MSAAKVPAGSGPGAVTAVAQVRSVVWELPRRRCRRPNRGSKVPAPNPPAQSAAPELLPPEAAWPSARHHSSADGRVPTARVGLGTLRPELPVTLTCHKTFPGLPWFAPHEARSLAAGCTEPGAALAAAPQQPEGSPWQGDGAQLPARPGSTELAGEAAAAGWPRLRQCVRPRGPPPLLDCGVGRAPPGGPSGPRSQQRAQGDGSGVGSQAAATPGLPAWSPVPAWLHDRPASPGRVTGPEKRGGQRPSVQGWRGTIRLAFRAEPELTAGWPHPSLTGLFKCSTTLVWGGRNVGGTSHPAPCMAPHKPSSAPKLCPLGWPGLCEAPRERERREPHQRPGQAERGHLRRPQDPAPGGAGWEGRRWDWAGGIRSI